MESDLAYLRRRASEERTAALAANHAGARKAHLEMAERYEDLVRGIAAHDEFLGMTFSQPLSAPDSPLTA